MNPYDYEHIAARYAERVEYVAQFARRCGHGLSAYAVHLDTLRQEAYRKMVRRNADARRVAAALRTTGLYR